MKQRLGQSRGEWPLKTVAIYSGGDLEPHTWFYLSVLASPGTCGGVFGGPNTELVSSFVDLSSQGVAGADKISTSHCSHSCRCCL